MLNVYPMAKPAKSNKKKARVAPWSVEADNALRELMEAAERATGRDRSQLIRECVRTSLRGIVQKHADDLRKSAENFSRLDEGNLPDKGK